MGLELKRGLELFFFKIEANYHSSPSCPLPVSPALLPYFLDSKYSCSLQFAHPMTQKLLILVDEENI
jgi:hypothetical protein